MTANHIAVRDFCTYPVLTDGCVAEARPDTGGRVRPDQRGDRVFGDRPAAAAATPAAVTRLDPAASAESRGGNVQRFRGDKRDFDISYETQLSYSDGTTRMKTVTIRVKKPDGHSYLVTAGEAESARDQTNLQLSSGVSLKADDGFELAADRATYSKADGLIHSDVPVTFAKGRMTAPGRWWTTTRPATCCRSPTMPA